MCVFKWIGSNYIAIVFQTYVQFDFYYDYILVLYSAILNSQPVAILFLVCNTSLLLPAYSRGQNKVPTAEWKSR